MVGRVPYQFNQPVGACRDVNELEFLACIHQTTSTESRVDASIVADDVQRLLISRHGLQVSKRDIEQHVLVDLVGRPDRFPDAVMDLRQMMALLLIPQLVRSGEEQDNLDAGEHERLMHAGSAERGLSSSLFETVLRIILEDSGVDTGEEEYPVLTMGVLRKIFSTYGENNVDDVVLEKMIERADTSRSGGPVMLNPETFQQALTSDVKLYRPEWEDRLSTHFEDVQTAQIERHRRAALASFASIAKLSFSKVTQAGEANELKRVFTFPTIDMDADTFESQSFHVLLIVSVVCFYVGYYNIILPSTLIGCRGSTFACTTLNMFLDWLAILAQLSLSGTAFVLLASLSNHSYHRKTWSTFFKLMGTAVVIPTLATVTVIGFQDVVETKESNSVKWAQFAAFFTAITLVSMQCGQLLSILMPEFDMKKLKSQYLARWLFSSGFHERDTKKAAVFKVNRMVKNALRLHEGEDNVGFDEDMEGLVNRTPYDLAMDRFVDLLTEKEISGGFIWVWKHFFTSRLSQQEGVFFGARFIGSNVAQWLVLVAFISVAIISISTVSQPINVYEMKWTRTLCFNDSGSFLYNTSEVTEQFLHENDLYFGYVIDDLNSTYTSNPRTLVIRSMLESIEALPGIISFVFEEIPGQKVADYFISTVQRITGLDLDVALNQPTRFRNLFSGNFLQVVYSELESRSGTTEVIAGLAVGGLFGALAIAIIALNYLPSYVISVLRFRSGSLGSLHDSRFLYLNQFNPFFTSLLVGSSFWGTAFSGAAAGVVFGSVVFLFLWKETQAAMLTLLAIIIVLTLTWLLRFGIVALIYTSVAKTFLRNKPAVSNITMLMFEAWNMGNALGYVLTRSLRVLIIAVFYIGRLDVWVLADGVGEFACFHPDNYPRAFNRDLLVHEAHRHPYAERLAVMYMLKLRFKSQFGRRAGGCWRLIFTSALMPWMIRYRVDRLPEGIRREITVSPEEFFDDTVQVDHGMAGTTSDDYEGLRFAGKSKRWGKSIRAVQSLRWVKSAWIQKSRSAMKHDSKGSRKNEEDSEKDLFRDEEVVQIEGLSRSFKLASSAWTSATSPTSGKVQISDEPAEVLGGSIVKESTEIAGAAASDVMEGSCNPSRRQSEGIPSVQSNKLLSAKSDVVPPIAPKRSKKKAKKKKAQEVAVDAYNRVFEVKDTRRGFKLQTNGSPAESVGTSVRSTKVQVSDVSPAVLEISVSDALTEMGGASTTSCVAGYLDGPGRRQSEGIALVQSKKPPPRESDAVPPKLPKKSKKKHKKKKDK